MPPTVAALYVERGGVYWDLPGVDAWDVERDARKYEGPHPVVAHPPCARWAKPLAKVNQTRYGHSIGGDGGGFRQALMSVQRFGGVLEHPAHSYAWDAPWFCLAKPPRGEWARAGGRTLVTLPAEALPWVTEVSQSAYGHRARKRTWLYYVGPQPPALDWSEPAPTAVTSWLQKTSTTLPRITKREASRTPIPFRDLLLDLARSARGEG